MVCTYSFLQYSVAYVTQVLLRSRAIETQCYVIAAAQVGRNTSKRTTMDTLWYTGISIKLTIVCVVECSGNVQNILEACVWCADC